MRRFLKIWADKRDPDNGWMLVLAAIFYFNDAPLAFLGIVVMLLISMGLNFAVVVLTWLAEAPTNTGKET